VLTYCTNIHPGEAWVDVLSNLESHALPVKQAVSPDRAFPLGLRLSNRAALEIDAREARRFQDWCEEHGCFVPTLNGFPHGQFHGAGVKEKVYLPDWRDPARAEYTVRLAELLAEWLPEGTPGSISTVPIAFRSHFDPRELPEVRRNLLVVLEVLDRIRHERGREIVLCLEPEPRCVIETTPEAVAFLEELELPAALSGLLGLCYDCCHQAVEFEDPAESLGLLSQAGVRIGKVQVSSSLRARAGQIAGLRRFDEPTYLHQVVARRADGSLERWDDLPLFLAEPSLAAFEECRVHFHVPIFATDLGDCGTTRFFLENALPGLDAAIPLEVETYSWNVLPPELQTATVTESIVRELEWVTALLERPRPEHP